MVATAEVERELTIEEQLAKWNSLIYREAKRRARLLGPLGDVQDVAQEIRLRVLDNRHSYDPRRGAFSTWLHIVCRGGLYLWDRQDHHTVPAVSLATPTGHDRRDSSELASFIPDERAVDPADEADARLLRQRVAAAIAELSPEERELVQRVFWDCEPVGHQRVRLNKVLAKLSEPLEPLDV